MLRRIVIAICLLLACGSAAGPVACGGDPVPPPSTTATTVATPGAAAADSVREMSEYSETLTRWSNRFAADYYDEAEEALLFADPLDPTDSELLRARQLLEAMRTSVAELNGIHAPAEVAQAHTQLHAALAGEVSALERYVNAIDWGSPRDAELAWRGLQEAGALWTRAVNGLSPYVDLSQVRQN